MGIMKDVNSYSKELTSEEIGKKAHREFVGGLWDELGKLQLEFLIKSGLKPNHKLLDIGCGCLRGGLHYLKYLDVGNYYGLDLNESLIEAGKIEVDEAGLSHKKPNLIVDDAFMVGAFGETFDFMVSVSLFTHLPFNMIVRCLTRVRENLLPHGVYYSTYFQAPTSAYLEPLRQEPGEIVTHYDSDPFHCSVDELAYLAELAGLELSVVGDWGHPRNQKMAAFRLPK